MHATSPKSLCAKRKFTPRPAFLAHPTALGAPPSPRLCFCGYSIFDSALCRSLKVEWLFPQEKATLHDLTMATRESKML
jgi:hypothetical protein